MRAPDAVDSRVAAALRFASELAAWIAAPWAASQLGWPVAVATLLVLIGLPTVFTVPGDKQRTVVAVPGIVRIGVELVQFAAGIVGAALVWPTWAAIAVAAVTALACVAQLPRWRWLLAVTGRSESGPGR